MLRLRINAQSEKDVKRVFKKIKQIDKKAIIKTINISAEFTDFYVHAECGYCKAKQAEGLIKEYGVWVCNDCYDNYHGSLTI